jgi:uncharacterized protein (TIGR02996 family)
MTDADFIRTIQEDPADDTARLVYADWLEERGDVRAEYLRAELELARLPADAPARSREAGRDCSDSRPR